MSNLIEHQKYQLAESQLGLKDSLPEGLEQLISSDSYDWWNMSHIIWRAPIPTVEPGTPKYFGVLTYIRQLEIALKPANPKEILYALARLRLHYTTQSMSEEELALMLEDYLNDFAHCPKDILEYACVQYRRDGKNLFFPKIGQLMALIEKPLYLRKNKLYKLQKMIEASKLQPNEEEIKNENKQ